MTVEIEGILTCSLSIKKTYLYNFDPLKPHFYIELYTIMYIVYIIFLFFAQKTWIVGTH